MPSEYRVPNVMSSDLTVDVDRTAKQESPKFGGAVRNATTLIAEQPSYILLAITCCENSYARPCAYGRTRVGDFNATVIRK